MLARTIQDSQGSFRIVRLAVYCKLGGVLKAFVDNQTMVDLGCYAAFIEHWEEVQYGALLASIHATFLLSIGTSFTENTSFFAWWGEGPISRSVQTQSDVGEKKIVRRRGSRHSSSRPVQGRHENDSRYLEVFEWRCTLRRTEINTLFDHLLSACGSASPIFTIWLQAPPVTICPLPLYIIRLPSLPRKYH